MIRAGTKSEVVWGRGNWIILDIGFSNDKKTCGFVFGDGSPMNLRYADARRTIIEQILKQNGPINLIIEAPLSVCFDATHNPKGRKIEKLDSKTRYWYTGLGCAVMTAAMYLIRDIQEATKDLPNVEVRLFEGFVSFKEGKTDNKKDVLDLRKKIKNAEQDQSSIYSADDLKFDDKDEIILDWSERLLEV